jgi:AraC family transcriptional regulator
LDYQIIEKPSFHVVGKAIRVSTKDGAQMKRIPEFWGECNRDGFLAGLTPQAAPQGVVVAGAVLGICMEFRKDLQEFTYMIAVEAAGEATPAGLVRKEIPAAAWAVFESVGAMPDAIQAVWGRIFSEFFPSTQYEHADGPELEVYPRGDVTSDTYQCAVWIPIVKK